MTGTHITLVMSKKTAAVIPNPLPIASSYLSDHPVVSHPF
jgi:hypothetical protein